MIIRQMRLFLKPAPLVAWQSIRDPWILISHCSFLKKNPKLENLKIHFHIEENSTKKPTKTPPSNTNNLDLDILVMTDSSEQRSCNKLCCHCKICMLGFLKYAKTNKHDLEKLLSSIWLESYINYSSSCIFYVRVS